MLYGEPPFYADTLVKTYSRIQNFDTELRFPSDVAVSNDTKDIIKKFLSGNLQFCLNVTLCLGANVRLGRDGSTEVKKHPFFKNDSWNFETICQGKQSNPRQGKPF